MKGSPVLQLYSVRNEAEKNFRETLLKTADAGFTGVEFAGYYGIAAEEMKGLLAEYGLNAVSSHCNALEDMENKVRYLNVVGAGNIVVPHYSFNDVQEVLRFAELMNSAGKLYKENGIALGYHNHSHEFKKDANGKYLLDIFFENTDPDYVKAQIDVCWVKVAGVEPAEYLKKYALRSNTIHLKEVKTIDPYCGGAIGTGIVDFKGIFEVLGVGSVYIVEQEELSAGEDMWQALKDSAKYVRKYT